MDNAGCLPESKSAVAGEWPLTSSNVKIKKTSSVRNLEVLSCNHCYSGKAIIIITYSECMFAALVIQHEMHMRHIVICGLSGSTVFFHLIS